MKILLNTKMFISPAEEKCNTKPWIAQNVDFCWTSGSAQLIQLWLILISFHFRTHAFFDTFKVWSAVTIQYNCIWCSRPFKVQKCTQDRTSIALSNCVCQTSSRSFNSYRLSEGLNCTLCYMTSAVWPTFVTFFYLHRFMMLPALNMNG